MSEEIKKAVEEMAAGMGASERMLGFMEGAIYALETIKGEAQAEASHE